MLIGRENERRILQDALAEEYSQFIAVYGRRRVGKTFLTDILNDLEWCGFIRGYSMLGKQVKVEIFQLIDNYTLFYYEFIHG